MRFLRTTSTRRLLAAVAGVLVAVIAGTAIAIGASTGGPKPVKKPLAQAVHSALAAPAVAGITARISFTNNLIDTSEIQNNDPLLTHASGRVWMSGPHQFRLELQGENGDAQVVVNGRSWWVYDPQSNTVYRGTLPAENQQQAAAHNEQLPTVAQIQSNLNQTMAHVNLSGAIPTDVAGRPTYTLRVSPRHSGGLLGRTELAWDAVRGVPLRFALYDSRNPSSPVLELKATNISYQRVSSRVFAVRPPKGAKVVSLATAPASPSTHAKPKPGAHQEVTGAANVAKHLSFRLAAPGHLDGLPQQSVSLLDWSGSPAALVSYGQNLGGIAVIEQKAEPPHSKPPAAANNGDGRQGLSLPSVTINGTTAQELDTAIGTVIRFTRGGVTYTVLGSVPPAAAVAAARAL
jgi:outer membrane lipoprotein-sorting protein